MYLRPLVMDTLVMDTVACIVLMLASILALTADRGSDMRIVAKMDAAHQAAVEGNDWRTVERILHPDFVLVPGDGKSYDRNT